MRTDQEIDLLERGPFPNRVDPWVEQAHYFHSLHEQMIGVMADRLRKPVLRHGYVLAREISLQVAESRIPDIFIRRDAPVFEPGQTPYEVAASELLAEAGTLVMDFSTSSALTIYERETQKLVTVIELVSPANKSRDSYIHEYEKRRESLYLNRGVNVVEIDLTRSYKHLITHASVDPRTYHAAIFLAGEGLRIVRLPVNQALKIIAIPLRGEVVALDLQKAYQDAYQQISLAGLIRSEERYTLDNLPFPSLLTDAERDEALAAVAAWEVALQDAKQA